MYLALTCDVPGAWTWAGTRAWHPPRRRGSPGQL